MNGTDRPTRAAHVARYIKDKTGVDLRVVKIDGFYYWCIPDDHDLNTPHAIDGMDGHCLYITRLNDFTLDRYLDALLPEISKNFLEV